MAYKGMAQIDKKELWTIPNLITYFRILCIPAYIVLMALAGVRANPVLLTSHSAYSRWRRAATSLTAGSQEGST